jgi:hypothetical protein
MVRLMFVENEYVRASRYSSRQYSTRNAYDRMSFAQLVQKRSSPWSTAYLYELYSLQTITTWEELIRVEDNPVVGIRQDPVSPLAWGGYLRYQSRVSNVFLPSEWEAFRFPLAARTTHPCLRSCSADRLTLCLDPCDDSLMAGIDHH